MFELSIGNVFLWILGTIIIGIILLNIIPTIFKRIVNTIYILKYSNYFVQKIVYEQMKEGKTLAEINNFIKQNVEKK